MWHSFGLLGDSHIKTSLAHDNQAEGTISGLYAEFANQIGKQTSWLQNSIFVCYTSSCSCVLGGKVCPLCPYQFMSTSPSHLYKLLTHPQL